MESKKSPTQSPRVKSLVRPTRSRRTAVVIFIVASALYVPFLSVQWDINGLYESRAVEAGGTALVSPNHLIYRYLGRLLFLVLSRTGFSGRATVPLQALTALAAACGIALVYLAYRRIVPRSPAAAIAALCVATSWSYWMFSTDAHYITPAAALVAASLFMAPGASSSDARAAGLGLLSAAAVLTWQANVFMIPSFAAGVLVLDRSQSPHVRLRRSLIYGITASVITAAVYAIIAVSVLHINSFIPMMSWLLSHGGDELGRPGIWGKWSVLRLPRAGVSAVASIIPVWEGLGLHALARGVITPGKLLGQFSVLAGLTLSSVALFPLIKYRLPRHTLTNLLWLLGAYTLFVPFIVWWDPFEPKWFTVPNIFLIGAFAVLMASLPRSRIQWLLVAASISTIASANFAYSIWPRHTEPSHRMEVAQCLATTLDSSDAFMPTDWNWFDYAEYLYGYEGDTVRLPRYVDPSTVYRIIDRSVADAAERGGALYVVSPNSYSREAIAWIETSMGIPLNAIYSRYSLKPIFRCGSVEFSRVAP